MNDPFLYAETSGIRLSDTELSALLESIKSVKVKVNKLR